MEPRDTWGGLTPKPRNDSVDSRMIAYPTTRVVLTAIGPTMLGMMWRNITRQLDAPDARAASTNSFSLIDRNRPRTTRAMIIQKRNDKMMMISVEELSTPKTGTCLPWNPCSAMAMTASA